MEEKIEKVVPHFGRLLEAAEDLFELPSLRSNELGPADVCLPPVGR